MNGKPDIPKAVTAVDAQLVLQHLRAMHPERSEQLNGICEFIRQQDRHNTDLRRDLLWVQSVADEYKLLYHGSLCQRVKRFFSSAKVNPNIG